MNRLVHGIVALAIGLGGAGIVSADVAGAASAVGKITAESASKPLVIFETVDKPISIESTAWRAGMPEWPSVNVPVPAEARDFTRFDRLVVDFVNETEDAMDSLSGFVSGTEGHVNLGLYRRGPVLPSNGFCRWVMPLENWHEAKKVDPADVGRVHFFLTRPSSDVRIRFHRLTLLPKGVAVPPPPEAFMRAVVAPRIAARFEAMGWRSPQIATLADAAAADAEFDMRVRRERRAKEMEGFRTACAAAGQDCPFLLGTATGMEKIRPLDGETPRPARTLDVRLARGERESVQLFVAPKTGALRNVRVSVSDFTDQAGGRFSASNVSIAVLGYVNVTNRPPYPTGRNVKKASAPGYERIAGRLSTGWWPDPILDFMDKVETVDAGVCQGFWLRVSCPRGQCPGTYAGTATVVADGGLAAALPFTVRVNAFDVPKASPLPLAITFGPGPTTQWEGAEGLALAAARRRDPLSPVNQWRKRRNEWCDFLSDYYLTYDSLYSDAPDFEMLRRQRDNGTLGMFNLGYWRVPEEGEAGRAAWSRNTLARLKKAYETAKGMGILDKAYVYGCDEATKDAFGRIQWAAAEIRRALPGVPISTTAYDSDYGVGTPLSVIDWFTPQTPVYDVEKARKARAAGHQVWWYFACSQHAPCANSFIEAQGIEMRSVMGPQTVKFRPDGYLYYQISIWNSIRPIEFGPFTDWNPRSWTTYDGDGSWTCCGPGGAPLSTIRLENFRDGLEDFAYAQALERRLADNPSAPWAAKARELLAVPDTLVQNVRNFSDDPFALYAWRNAMADVIEASK